MVKVFKEDAWQSIINKNESVFEKLRQKGGEQAVEKVKKLTLKNLPNYVDDIEAMQVSNKYFFQIYDE